MGKSVRLIGLIALMVLMTVGCALAFEGGTLAKQSGQGAALFSESDIQPWTTSLMPAFEAASAEYDVPAELLVTLAYFGSGFTNRGAAPNRDGGFGVMALRDNILGGESLNEAAALLKVGRGKIITDPALNIKGAAAVLDSYARSMGIDRSAGFEAWLGPVIKYAGFDEEDSKFFAYEVFKMLATGLDIVSVEGEQITFGPRNIGQIDLESLKPGGPNVVKPGAASDISAMSSDYGPAIWDPAASCNYSTATHSSDTIVVHVMEGSLAGTRSWFKNCNRGTIGYSSCQYNLGSDGTIVQMVLEAQTAWHAGCYNSRSIGIEHEGYISQSSFPTAMYNASARLSADMCGRRNIPTAKNTVGPGIVGHIDITNCCCGTHTDPGNGWNWSYYIGQVKASAYNSSYNAQSYPATMSPGQQVTAWVEFKNTGTVHWKPGSGCKLGTQGPQDRSSPFCTSGDWLACNRPTAVDQADIGPNGIGRFSFILTAPSTPGTYTEQYKLVQENVTWFGATVTFTITVTGSTGTLSGNIKDNGDGNNVVGATVSVSGGGSATTDANGNYAITNVSTGTKTVTVSKSGFDTLTDSNVVINSGQTTTKNYTLVWSDTIAPSVPTGLTASGDDYNSVHLNWTASADNVGVTGYEIWRNGTAIATVGAVTSYDDTSAGNGTTYSYTVRARDLAGNWSGQSTAASATTWTLLLSDPFTNLNAWTAGTVADGTTRGVSLDAGTGSNLGGGSGAPAARSDIGSINTNGSYSYVGYAAPFAVGYVECSFYDSSTTSNSRNGIAYRKFSGTSPRLVYFLGNDQTNSGTAYSAEVYGATAAWTKHVTSVTRTVGWQKFKVAIDGTNSRFYINGSLVDTIAEPVEAAEGVDRVYIGNNYNVNTAGWYDDVKIVAPTPPAPVAGSATAIGQSSVTWNFTEGNRDYEQGFHLEDTGGANKGSAGRGATSITESGLDANTSYTRVVTTYNGSLESAASGQMSAVTLSVPPAGNITSNPAAGNPAISVVFTSTTSFGVGGVQYYRYAWDQSATHTWTGSETQWSSGTLTLAPALNGSWYLHVKGYNSANAENGTADVGPYMFIAPDPPTNVVATSDSYSTAHITWAAPGYQVSNYEVWRNGAAVTTLPGTQTTFDDSGLTQGTAYTYQVKAKNSANNWSDLSIGGYVKTWSILLNDSFANLNNWTASKVADGTIRGLTSDAGTGSNLSGGSGAPSGRSDLGGTSTNGSYSYFGYAQPFAVGYIECSFYDSSTTSGSRNHIAFRKSTNDDISTPRQVYMIGNDQPNSTTAYTCGVYGVAGGWIKHAAGGTRSVGWQRFGINIDGSNVRFYRNGSLVDTIAEPAEAGEGVNRFYIGNNYNPNTVGWYDDFFACFPTPPTPVPGTPSVTSTSITWTWTEGPSDYEQGFNIEDTNGTVIGTAGRNTTSWTETGLAPNTTYTRVITAWNGPLESPVSITVSATTAP